MNIEAYDIDSLRKLVRSLQNENTVLKEQLQKANMDKIPILLTIVRTVIPWMR